MGIGKRNEKKGNEATKSTLSFSPHYVRFNEHLHHLLKGMTGQKIGAMLAKYELLWQIWEYRLKVYNNGIDCSRQHTSMRSMFRFEGMERKISAV